MKRAVGVLLSWSRVHNVYNSFFFFDVLYNWVSYQALVGGVHGEGRVTYCIYQI